MPVWVKGKKDERKWDRAQEIVDEQYPDLTPEDDRYWQLVTGVYKRMGGHIRSSNPSDLRERAVSLFTPLVEESAIPVLQESGIDDPETIEAIVQGVVAVLVDVAVKRVEATRSEKDESIAERTPTGRLTKRQKEKDQAIYDKGMRLLKQLEKTKPMIGRHSTKIQNYSSTLLQLLNTGSDTDRSRALKAIESIEDELEGEADSRKSNPPVDCEAFLKGSGPTVATEQEEALCGLFLQEFDPKQFVQRYASQGRPRMKGPRVDQRTALGLRDQYLDTILFKPEIYAFLDEVRDNQIERMTVVDRARFIANITSCMITVSHYTDAKLWVSLRHVVSQLTLFSAAHPMRKLQDLVREVHFHWRGPNDTERIQKRFSAAFSFAFWRGMDRTLSADMVTRDKWEDVRRHLMLYGAASVGDAQIVYSLPFPASSQRLQTVFVVGERNSREDPFTQDTSAALHRSRTPLVEKRELQTWVESFARKTGLKHTTTVLEEWIEYDEVSEKEVSGRERDKQYRELMKAQKQALAAVLQDFLPQQGGSV